MEAVSSAIKVSLPNYLRNLPIPDSFSGFTKLSSRDWISLIPFVGTAVFIGYVTYQAFVPSKLSAHGKAPVNLAIDKDKSKVVNIVEIEDLDKEKISYCRCWRSEKFPYCDGSHNKHNEECFDNVGPLVLKRKEKH